MLISYLRNPKTNQRSGVVVAVDKGQIGFSICCKKDRFDRRFGIKIAEGRARTYFNVVDWYVNLVRANNKEDTITVSFHDLLNKRYPDCYVRPAFQFKEGGDFIKMKQSLLDVIIRMYERSLKYFK